MGDWDVVKTQKIGEWDVVRSEPISAITGKPVPTGLESGEQAISGVKKIARGAGPIVGDIALTALAPQVSLPMKAGRLGKMGFQALNLLLRGGASAAGSAGGAALSDIATGEELDTGRVKEEAILGAGGEVLTTALGTGAKIGGKILKPIFEAIPDITMSGAAVKKFYNKQFKEKATERAESFLFDIAPESVKKHGAKSKNLNIMVNQAFSDTGGAYELYKDVIRDFAAKNEGLVQLDDTAQMIGELLQNALGIVPEGASRARIRNEALEKFNYTPRVKKALSDLFETDLINPARVELLVAEVFQNKGWVKLTVGEREARLELKEAVMSDLDKIGAADLKTSADAEFKALAKFNSLRRIYNKALVVTDPNTLKKSLSPAKLHEEILANEKRILADPELSKVWPQLEIEANAANEAVKAIVRTETDTGAKSLLRTVGPAGALYVFGPKGVAAAEGIGAASAWALLSDPEKSLLKKMFKTTGKLARPTTKAALRLGGRELDFGKTDQKSLPNR